MVSSPSKNVVRVALPILLLGVFAVGGWTALGGLGTAPPADATPVVEPEPLPALPADRVTTSVPIRRGSTFGRLMHDRGLPARAIRAAALDHYDLARIRPDRDLSVVYADGQAEAVEVRYAIDEDRTVVVSRDEQQWTAHLDEVVYTSDVGTRSFELTRSLWQDGLEAGLRPTDLVRLATIFEYDVDFNSELKSGARLSLVADILQAEGKRPRLGDIYAVRLINRNTTVTAIRFEGDDGEAVFYQPDGSSMRRPFLRSPLEFSRVTSGFNPKRFHPILKKRRPHNGTDFGAPTGTPVRAVADAKVVRAGRAGGHGNFVKLDHEGGYETSYSHLSRLKVRKGQRVRQGDIIGTVGSTGLATGPHLHFQMWKSGRYVDAMRVDLPHQAPLARASKAEFQAQVDIWLPRLDDDGVVDGDTGEQGPTR